MIRDPVNCLVSLWTRSDCRELAGTAWEREGERRGAEGRGSGGERSGGEGGEGGEGRGGEGRGGGWVWGHREGEEKSKLYTLEK